MFTALVCEAQVPWRQICTHWEGWGKVHGDRLHYRLSMPSWHVVTAFGPYWTKFIQIESQDDGEIPTSVYAELRASGYPPLDVMLKSHASLFSAVVMDSLQVELAEYVIPSPHQVDVDEPAYFIQSMNSVSVVDAS